MRAPFRRASGVPELTVHWARFSYGTVVEKSQETWGRMACGRPARVVLRNACKQTRSIPLVSHPHKWADALFAPFFSGFGLPADAGNQLRRRCWRRAEAIPAADRRFGHDAATPQPGSTRTRLYEPSLPQRLSRKRPWWSNTAVWGRQGASSGVPSTGLRSVGTVSRASRCKTRASDGRTLAQQNRWSRFGPALPSGLSPKCPYRSRRGPA